MTEAYDPLNDPTSDGYAKVELSKTDWKAGKTEPALVDNSTFKKWGKRILWVALAAIGFWFGLQVIAAYKVYSAEKEAIEAPQAAEPEQPTPPKKKVRKTTTEKIADKASNTPATAEYMPEVKAVKPNEIAEVKQPLSARELAYEKRLNEFESRLTKGEKP